MQTVRPAAALGFILNLPSGSKIAGWLPPSIFARKHWIAIRKIGDDLYFNLDSHLSEPEVIGAVSFLSTVHFEKSIRSTLLDRKLTYWPTLPRSWRKKIGNYLSSLTTILPTLTCTQVFLDKL